MCLNQQIKDASRKIFCLRDIVLSDECRTFVDAAGHLAFVRHDYAGEDTEIARSHVVIIGGDERPAFPLTAVSAVTITLHQTAGLLPSLAAPEAIDETTAERLWRDRRGCDVVIGRTEEGLLRAVAVGGSEPEFPCTSRDAGAALSFDRAG